MNIFFYSFFSLIFNNINKNYSFIMQSQKVRSFYLIGKNINSSLSPLLHNKLFQIKNIQHYHYNLWQQGKLPHPQHLISNHHFGGASITIPFKKSYYQLIKNTSTPEIKVDLKYKGNLAQKSKIINTLVKNKESQLIGYNTDIYGIEKVLRNVKNIGNVLILGAGATSETFCYYFQKNSLWKNIFIFNRNQQRVTQLAMNYNKVIDMCHYDKRKIHFIVNTLPSQVLEKNVETYAKLLQKIDLNQQLSYMDVNYRGYSDTIQKLLVKKTINKYSGLHMLIWQAIEQNRLFCGQMDKSSQNLAQEYFNILNKLIQQQTSFRS